MYSHRQHKISCVCIVFLYLLLASSYIIRISCLFVVVITATLVLHFRKCKRLINLGVGASCQSRWSQILSKVALRCYFPANLKDIFLIYHSKSLYKSCARSHSYGIEYVIWADFGPVGNTEKNRANYDQLLRLVFHVKRYKNIVAPALKSSMIFLL